MTEYTTGQIARSLQRIAEDATLLGLDEEERKQLQEAAKLLVPLTEGERERYAEMLESIASRIDFDGQYETRSPDLVARILRESAALLRAGEHTPQQDGYELLKRAVNESSDGCLPGCDSYGHEENCPEVNSAFWLENRQREIERLRAELTALRAGAPLTEGEQEGLIERLRGLESYLKLMGAAGLPGALEGRRPFHISTVGAALAALRAAPAEVVAWRYRFPGKERWHLSHSEPHTIEREPLDVEALVVAPK